MWWEEEVDMYQIKSNREKENAQIALKMGKVAWEEASRKVFYYSAFVCQRIDCFTPEALLT